MFDVGLFDLFLVVSLWAEVYDAVGSRVFVYFVFRKSTLAGVICHFREHVLHLARERFKPLAIFLRHR